MQIIIINSTGMLRHVHLVISELLQNVKNDKQANKMRSEILSVFENFVEETQVFYTYFRTKVLHGSFLACLDEVQEELLYYPRRRH